MKDLLLRLDEVARKPNEPPIPPVDIATDKNALFEAMTKSIEEVKAKDKAEWDEYNKEYEKHRDVIIWPTSLNK